MTRALIVVNYHSAALTREAIHSARAASSTALEIIVVDNTTSSEELLLLDEAGADTVLAPPRNLGYGAAINLGVRHSSAEEIVMSNPDVRFGTGSIDRLIQQLSDGATITGPKFTWDDGGQWILPPADLVSGRSKMDELLASHLRSWETSRDRRRIRRRIRFWSLARPAEVPALSGAVLAMRREDFDAMHGFDESFHLYFEETDLMRRVSRRGGTIVYVPGSVVRHLHDQSFSVNPEARTWYSESERQYLRRWSGETILRLMDRWGQSRIESPHDCIDAGGVLTPPPGTELMELSPLGSFDTAAGMLLRAPEVEIAPEVLESYTSDVLYARALDRDARELARWRITLQS